MPQAVPDIVNEYALKLASEGYYGNIRILGAWTPAERTFHILFYNDELEALKAYTIRVGAEKNSVEKVLQVNLPYQNLDELKLSKILTDTKCWDLATVYKGTSWTGDSFTFSQQTTTYGYYHKVIYDLSKSQSCCADNYDGSFNDAIYSHRWIDDYYSPEWRIARPICLHAFALKDRDKFGENSEFELNYAYETGFGIAYYYSSCFQVNEEYNWGTCDVGGGTASSLDMFYRVFSPDMCY